MVSRLIGIMVLSVILTACEERPLQAVGQLESDRVELISESSEPIVSIAVTEGDQISAGALVLSQQAARLEIRGREARAGISRLQALLQEQLNGPRAETIAATRASLQEAEVERDYRVQELSRLEGLLARSLTSQESVDLARKQLDTARARIARINAQLDELEAGTRTEQIDQTRAQLEQANAQLEAIEFDIQRLEIRAPVAGRIDSLPFETGERPRIGDVVAVMLTGEQPHARVYIPEPLRVGLESGDELQVHVDGLDNPLTGTIRRIASEASFTPYFALTERDRSRLAYVAEVTLPATSERLPEGVPVQILFSEAGE